MHLAQKSKQIGCVSIILNIERLKKNEKKMEINFKKISFFFQFFKAQSSPPLAFWCNGWVWISNYIMSGIQKPSLQVKISNSFVAPVISKITFHYEPPCMCLNFWIAHEFKNNQNCLNFSDFKNRPTFSNTQIQARVSNAKLYISLPTYDHWLHDRPCNI